MPEIDRRTLEHIARHMVDNLNLHGEREARPITREIGPRSIDVELKGTWSLVDGDATLPGECCVALGIDDTRRVARSYIRRTPYVRRCTMLGIISVRWHCTSHEYQGAATG